MNSPTKQQQFFNLIKDISVSGLRAEAMSTEQLTTALAELEIDGGEHIASLPSAVKGEAIHRLKHPFSWRLSRLVDRIKRHAN